MSDGNTSTASGAFMTSTSGRSRSGRKSRRNSSGRWRQDGELPSGSRVDRYVVLYRLGRGGMGVVYAAYDPQLDRKVAVKVLRTRALQGQGRDDQESHDRMLREAQALARLSHPNVVAVHDAGLLDGRVFVAMDFVDGETLRRWLKSKTRSRREILQAYVQAGDALVAAHAAEIVHRDFKPDNALIGRDGRVQVLDFGLARLQGDTAAEVGPAIPSEVEPANDKKADKEADTKANTCTRTGSGERRRQGTPAYMAPEQHERERVGPAADQYAFCVSLWEALCERPPFAGRDEVLLSNIKQGKLTEPPRGRLSGHLRRILRRGLSADPKARYPSMQALLLDLRHDPRRHWRRASAAVGTLGLAAASVVAYAQLSGEPPVCDGAQARLHEVWGPTPRAHVRAAISGSSRGHAAHTRDTVEQALDDYATRWTEAYTEACTATHVRQEQSEGLLDLRMACLSRRLDELGAVTSLLAEADAEVVDNALATVDGLPPLSRCRDVMALRERQSLPRNLERREEIEKTRARVAQAAALERSGQIDEAIITARAALRRAAELDYPPLVAQAGLALGEALELKGEAGEARATLIDAEVAAEIARDDALLAEIRVLLVMVVGDRLRQPEPGHTWARLARATLERQGGVPRLEAMLENNIALVLDHEARPEDVLAHQRRAVELAEQAQLSELRLATLYNNLAGTLSEVGQFEEALQRAQQARLTWEKTLGARHHRVATAMSTLGYIHQSRGDTREALRWYERAYTQMVAELGSQSPHTADILTNIAICQANLGQLDEAEGSFRRVLALQRRAFGAEHLHVAQAHANLGVLLSRRGQPEDALAEQRRALAIKERALGRDHAQVAASLEEVANALEKLSRHAEALPPREQALEIRERVYGPDHPDLSTALGNLAHNLIDLDALDRALTVANRALLLADDPSVPPLDRAFVRLVLAKVLSKRNEDLDRARDLFDRAQMGLADQDAPNERALLAELADHHGWEVVAPPAPSPESSSGTHR
ncbi:MAG: serine/threonine-protein kinase [Myxococcota bacterium]